MAYATLFQMLDQDASLANTPNGFGWYPLHCCANGKKKEFVKTAMLNLLVNMKADVEAERGKNGQRPLMVAANTGSLKLCEALILNGADATARNNEGTSVHDAARSNKIVQEALHQAGARKGEGTTSEGRLLFLYTFF